jgi:MFS transporter, AAHS family, 4-hydroxybenzoate transporter
MTDRKGRIKMNNVRQMLDTAPLSRTQIIAITLTAVINAVDAYDVLAMSFVSPEISRAWGINKAELGLALSSGFLGMVVGSFFLSPLADKYGRRKIILTTLALMAIGMLMAAFSRSVVELAIWRIITGLGIGTLVPINTPLAVEYANGARRRLALAVMSIGFPVGATLGGFAAAMLMQYSSWHAVFLFGAALSTLLFGVAFIWLPEPPAFLLSKRPPDALARLNAYLIRCGHAPISELPPIDGSTSANVGPYRAIFSKGAWPATVSLSLANFLCLMTVYYILSWTPQMVADLGYSSSFATLVSSTSAMVGIVAVLGYGLFAQKWPLRQIAGTHMIGLALATGIFGIGGFQPPLLLMLAGIVGIFLYAGGVALYGVIVDTFAPSVRATGVGFAMGMGRIAGAIAPALAGQLFYIGMSRFSVSIILALCALGSAALIFANGRLSARTAY